MVIRCQWKEGNKPKKLSLPLPKLVPWIIGKYKSLFTQGIKVQHMEKKVAIEWDKVKLHNKTIYITYAFKEKRRSKTFWYKLKY